MTLKCTRTEDQQIDGYITANNLTVTQTTASGVRFILTKANPTKAASKSGQKLIINYSGKLIRASSGFEGGMGAKTVGTAAYIAGFEEGLALLKVGEKATVIFPSVLGYGSTGAGRDYSTLCAPSIRY